MYAGQGSFRNRAAAERHGGFTLVEVAVVVTVMVIISMVAVPALGDLVAGQRVKTSTFDLYAGLAFARSEAIKRNVTIDVTPRDGNFSNGWQILNGTTLLRDQGTLKGVSVAGQTATLSYDAQGRLTAGGRVDFRVVPANDTVMTRCVVVDVSGRAAIRIDRNRDGNCVNG